MAGNSDELDAELYVPEALLVAPPAAPPPQPPAAAPPPPPAAPVPAAKDVTAPVVSRLRFSPSAFRVGARPRGTTIRYRLSETGRVTFTIERASAGRRVGTRCRLATRANRARTRCTRHTRVGRLTQSGRKGDNRRMFSGAVAGRALTAGRYRLTVSARDAAGNVSKRRTATFRIVRARR